MRHHMLMLPRCMQADSWPILRLHLHVHARNARFGKESKSMGQPA